MDATWIVSANASRARFFSQPTARAPLSEVSTMINGASRLRAADLETDGLGQRSASKSQHSVGAPTQPSGYQPNQSPAEHQTELFAREVADYLSRACQSQRFRNLCLVASPGFLGELRRMLDKNVAAQINFELNKDYTQLSPEQLREQIDALRP
jgi:protein required for attachment to host cells